MKQLNTQRRAYLAGFLDGDGSIFAQIVAAKDMKYKYRIRVSIGFYQHKRYKWFLQQIQKDLKCGSLRDRKDGMIEYVITAADPVKQLLLQIQDDLILKQRQAHLVLQILEQKTNLQSPEEFLEVCRLTDKVAALNYSKKRTITAERVAKVLQESPEKDSQNEDSERGFHWYPRRDLKNWLELILDRQSNFRKFFG